MLDILQRENFDVAVIGGGCTGSMIALDAALRGYKVAVVERNDFSSGTSSRSTNLLHGGVRYLENAVKHLDWTDFKLVTEALHERRFHVSERSLHDASNCNCDSSKVLVSTTVHPNRSSTVRFDCFSRGTSSKVLMTSHLLHSHSIRWKEMQYLFPKLDFDWIRGGLV